MNKFLLDTNIVSHFLRGHPQIDRHIKAHPLSKIVISAITEAELLYGIARKPTATNLRKTVLEFLAHVESLPWTQTAARSYGELRGKLERQGRAIGPLDMLIAAHAHSIGSILVTNDKALKSISEIKSADWTL